MPDWWTPQDPGDSNDPTYARHRNVTRGDHDAYIRDFARDLKAFDGDVHGVLGIFASFLESDGTSLTRSLGPGLDRLGGFTKAITSQDDRDFAVYSQLSWDVFEWASLTGGVRYTNERRAVSRTSIAPLGDISNFPATDPVVQFEGSESGIFTKWTPMASLGLEVRL